LRLHALETAVLLPEVVDENLASGREPHASRPALEQLRAKLLLDMIRRFTADAVTFR
jgi:hypothetical protein